MTKQRAGRILISAALVFTPLVGVGVVATQAAAAPVKLVLNAHFGAEVNMTTKGDVCTVESGDVCQPGAKVTRAGGYDSPEGVAVSPLTGNLYVADFENDRVQELSASGQFILTFGREVNETKDDEPSATAAERNVCTAASKDKCKAGVRGGGAEQLNAFSGASLTVDPTSGNVYVQDIFNWRIDEYTSGGKFVLMFGKEVNGSTKANICSQQEVEENGVVCKAGVEGGQTTSEPGVFKFSTRRGDLFAVGPSGVLYVGDERRVQKFTADGKSGGEFSLEVISSEPESRVLDTAVDGAGDLYLVYQSTNNIAEIANVVREFDPSGKQIAEFTVHPKQTGRRVIVKGLSRDAQGRLALAAEEISETGEPSLFSGLLFEGMNGRLITEFTVSGGDGLSFASNGELYAADSARNEVERYRPVTVGEFVTQSTLCSVEGEKETSILLQCELLGEVNPENVPETESAFVWSASSQTAATPWQHVPIGNSPVGVHQVITGLEPDTPLGDELIGVDREVKLPEELKGGLVSRVTSIVPPKTVGDPSAMFVGASSADLFGEANPENTDTTLAFQYGACASLDVCSTLRMTKSLHSAVYGVAGITLEASGLQPDTTYHYRLVADNEHEVEHVVEGGRVESPEATFTTKPNLNVEAIVEPASAIGTSSATIAGSVNPGGYACSFTFELTRAGADTSYVAVASGSVGAGTSATQEAVTISGLEPGVTYTYRLSARNGYATAIASPLEFTTMTVPYPFGQTLVQEIPVPRIGFPQEPAKNNKKKPRSKKKTVTKHRKSQRPKHRGHKVRVHRSFR